VAEPKDVVAWFFFKVIIPLTPILLSVLIVLMTGLFRPKWVWFLRDGGLFFFTTSLCSSSIPMLNPPLTGNLVFYALLLLIILSAALFGLTSFLQFAASTENDVGSTKWKLEQTEQWIGMGSLCFAVTAVFMGYLACMNP